MPLPDFIAEPLEVIERHEPLPGALSLAFDLEPKEPPMSKAATATAAPVKRGPGRPKKIVPSATFAQEPPASIDHDGLLRQALHIRTGSADRWDALGAKAGGVSDDEILDRLGDDWEANPSGKWNDGEWCAKGGAKPRIWLGMDVPTGPPTLQGKELVQACRRVITLPDSLSAQARGRGRQKSAQAVEEPAQSQALDKMVVIDHRAVEVAKIFPSPENPRFDWDSDETKAFLRTLGESMRDHTQLEAIIIRESGELIDGESRWRAAKLVELPTLDAKIVRCTDAEAALVRMMSYRQRRDLNPIEEARGLKLLLVKYGCSQRELEERIRISQGQISNRIRLLDLPEAWQAKIMSGEITATDGRTLATFSDCPKFFERLPEDLAWQKNFNTHATPSGQIVLAAVDSICRVTRPTTKGADGPKFKLSDELREKLDVRDVKVGRVDEPRAFNVELWDQLQKEALKAAAERAANRATKPAKPAAAIPGHTLRALWCDWLGRQIAARFEGKLKRPDQELLERLALLYWVGGMDCVGSAFRPTGDEGKRPTLSLMKRSRDSLIGTMCETFLEGLRDGDVWNLGDLAEIVSVAAELGITLDAFVPDLAMLEDLPEDARVGLFGYWENLTPAKTPKKQAEQLVANWDEGWIPEVLKTIELDGVSF